MKINFILLFYLAVMCVFAIPYMMSLNSEPSTASLFTGGVIWLTCLAAFIAVGDVLLSSGKIIIVAEKDTLNDNTFNCIYNNTNEIINLNFNSYGEIQLLLRLNMPNMFTTKAIQYAKSNTNDVKQIYFQEVLKVLQNP